MGGGGGLCCVWWGFVESFEFFFPLLLRFLDLKLVGIPVIVVVVCAGGCSGGCCCGGGSWLVATVTGLCVCVLLVFE